MMTISVYFKKNKKNLLKKEFASNERSLYDDNNNLNLIPIKQQRCCFIIKSKKSLNYGKICGRRALFTKGNIFFCGLHKKISLHKKVTNNKTQYNVGLILENYLLSKLNLIKNLNLQVDFFFKIYNFKKGKLFVDKYDIIINNYYKISIKNLFRGNPSLINSSARYHFINNIYLSEYINDIDKMVLSLKKKKDYEILLIELISNNEYKLWYNIIHYFIFEGVASKKYLEVNQANYIAFFISRDNFYIFFEPEFEFLYELMLPYLKISLRNITSVIQKKKKRKLTVKFTTTR